MTQKLTLISGNARYSSWSMRGWLAAAHAGLGIESKFLALFTDAGTRELRALVPSAKVPALLVSHPDAEDHCIFDSAAIIDYLARLVPEKTWWPVDMAAYGFARSIAAEMHSGFMLLRAACPMNLQARYQNLKIAPALQTEIDSVFDRWTTALTRYSDKSGPYLFGAWSAADIMFAPVVTRFQTYGIVVPDIVSDYCAAVLDQHDVKAWFDIAAEERDHIAKYDAIVGEGDLLGAS